MAKDTLFKTSEYALKAQEQGLKYEHAGVDALSKGIMGAAQEIKEIPDLAQQRQLGALKAMQLQNELGTFHAKHDAYMKLNALQQMATQTNTLASQAKLLTVQNELEEYKLNEKLRDEERKFKSQNVRLTRAGLEADVKYRQWRADNPEAAAKEAQKQRTWSAGQAKEERTWRGTESEKGRQDKAHTDLKKAYVSAVTEEATRLIEAYEERVKHWRGDDSLPKPKPMSTDDAYNQAQATVAPLFPNLWSQASQGDISENKVKEGIENVMGADPTPIGTHKGPPAKPTPIGTHKGPPAKPTPIGTHKAGDDPALKPFPWVKGYASSKGAGLQSNDEAIDRVIYKRLVKEINAKEWKADKKSGISGEDRKEIALYAARKFNPDDPRYGSGK